ncbi:MAG: hypothetical protein ACRCU3_09440 [Eubacteriaceae bacterium]
MTENQFIFLTMAYSDIELTLLRNYFLANGIPIITKEKGFGGPIRSIFMGNFTPAHIEVFVKERDYDDALMLLDYGAFNADLNEEDWMKEEEKKKNNH